MKKILDFFKGVLISLWLIIAIFATVCLLQSDKYGVSKFGDYSLFVIDNNSLENYHKYDVVITKKDGESDYDKDSLVFFYFGNKDINSYINLGKIIDVKRNKNAEDTYYFDEDVSISYDKIIGGANKTTVIFKIGLFLNILQSKWGFMFLVILPTIYAIVSEINTIVKEVKKELKKEE